MRGTTQFGGPAFTGCHVAFIWGPVVDRLTGAGPRERRAGTRRSVVVVRCEHCGARYETDLPVRAVERIRRCSRCGFAALETVPDGEPEPAEAAGEPDER